MRESSKKEIAENYDQALVMHARLREVARQIPTCALLLDLPPEPTSHGELRNVLEALRKDTNIVTAALYDWDRKRNGCEVRTREMIEQDIERDTILLKNQMSDPLGRDPFTIRANIEYDRMQLGRS